MGFMDKVKSQAEQALAKAQQGVAQGQEKLDALQGKRAGDALLRDLGAAYYAQQRTGGPADAVATALAALDAHVATHGPLDTAPSAGTGDGVAFDPGPAAGGGVAPPTAPPPAGGGSFNLDDL
jgi:hypothetical protein